MAYCIIQTDNCRSTKNIDPKLNPFLAALFRKLFLIIFNQHFLFADFCPSLHTSPAVLAAGQPFPQEPSPEFQQQCQSLSRGCARQWQCPARGEQCSHCWGWKCSCGTQQCKAWHKTTLASSPWSSAETQPSLLLFAHRTAFSCPDLTSIFPEHLNKFITY